jgi:hypothetical protein
MVNLLVRRNNLEPHGHPGNAIIRVEGPEPSTATVLTIPSGEITSINLLQAWSSTDGIISMQKDQRTRLDIIILVF